MSVRSCKASWLGFPLAASLMLCACSNQPSQEPAYVPVQPQGQAQPAHHPNQAPNHRRQAEVPAPAANMLIQQGDQALANGQPQRALNWLERAQRISPRAPLVYLALARARAAMQHYAQAQQLVFKGLSLAGGDTRLRSRAWSLMADIRQQAGDASGAAAARRKAGQ